MRLLASLLFSILALASLAEGKRTQGGTLRVLREKRMQGWQLFIAFSDGEGRVQLYGDSRPAQGSSFAVVDTKGSLGEIRVDDVAAEPPNNCPGLVQARGTYALEPRRSFSDSVAVAIGPAERSLAHARLYYKERDRDRARGHERGLPYASQATLLGAIDVDGDESLDVAVYLYDCQRGPETAIVHFGVSEVCIESFSREGASWRAIRRTRVDHCF